MINRFSIRERLILGGLIALIITGVIVKKVRADRPRTVPGQEQAEAQS